MEKQTKTNIVDYNDRELSQYFLNVEPLHIRMMTANEDTLRKVAEDSFIFTEAQWNDLLATRKEWIGEGVSQYRKDYVNSKFKAIKDCRHGEPLHYHHDGCPSCETEEEATKTAFKGDMNYHEIVENIAEEIKETTGGWETTGDGEAEYEDWSEEEQDTFWDGIKNDVEALLLKQKAQLTEEESK